MTWPGTQRYIDQSTKKRVESVVAQQANAPIYMWGHCPWGLGNQMTQAGFKPNPHFTPFLPPVSCLYVYVTYIMYAMRICKVFSTKEQEVHGIHKQLLTYYQVISDTGRC